MTYDVIVLGSGPAGFYFAKTAASHGKKVLIIEKEYLGGTGFRTGCLPVKKYLDGLRQARAVELATNEEWCSGTVDKKKLYTALNKNMSTVEELMNRQLHLRNIDLVYGEPTVESSTCVLVESKKYSASQVVIATGTSTNPLLGCAVDEKIILTHKGMVAQKTLPSSVVIIGGNVEGIEFASYLSGFGVEVTIVALGSELLEGTDRDLCQETLDYIKANNGRVLLKSEVTSIEVSDGQGIVTLADTTELIAEKVLITGARSGNIPRGLEALSPEMSDTCLAVDEHYETSIKGVYAIGDVNGLHGMAHIAIQQGIQLADYLYNGTLPVRNYDSLPRSIFTINEIAGAGLQENACKEMNISYSVKEVAFDQTFRGWSKALRFGKIKLIFDDRQYLIGAWMTGESASDYIGMIGLWIDRKISLEEIKASLFIHPSLGEGLLDAAIN